MKINCVMDLKMLNGDVIEKASSQEFIANSLMMPSFKESTPVKRHDMALKINNEGFIDVDTEDYNLLLKALKNTECGVVPLIQAQLIKHVEKEHASYEAVPA